MVYFQVCNFFHSFQLFVATKRKFKKIQDTPSLCHSRMIHWKTDPHVRRRVCPQPSPEINRILGIEKRMTFFSVHWLCLCTFLLYNEFHILLIKDLLLDRSSWNAQTIHLTVMYTFILAKVWQNRLKNKNWLILRARKNFKGRFWREIFIYGSISVKFGM